MQPTTRSLIPATLAIAALGCGEASEEAGPSGGAPASATVSTTDSAGVGIVQISDLGALDLPELNLRLLYSTAADIELYHVVGAVFLPDSSLAIADRGSSEVVFLDQQGRERQRAGREGEGPGEYVDMARIGVDAGGTLSVFDARLQRFTFLDAQGDVTGVQRIQLNEAYVPLVHLAGGGFVAVLETRPFRPLGLQRGPLFLVVFDQAGEVVDTLGRWAGKERRVSPDQMTAVGFGATTLYAGGGSHAVLATTDSVDVTLYEGPVPLTSIRGGHAPREVTSDEKEAWTDLYLEVFPENLRPSQRQVLEQAGVRDTYPAIGALKVDADGAIWLGGYPRLDDMERRWTVLGPDGIPVGRLRLPVYRAELLKVRDSGITGWAALELETTIPSTSHELLDVAAGRIAVLRTGEMGEEFIEVYAVELP
ncbi:MAG: hypothetical protein F4087_07210 [Gemmatimonadetes bacterium]|nr:hypothetical protein [Gemmatimonadota bacterium]MYE69584.1 hypothetical protein [Gemmatimonadota bacterium]MYJ68275.1 hypothetical protein [Gemmatimonadota bacterium]